MLNVKLKYLRTIIEEISRLEKLTDQMSRVRNQSKKQDYYEDLKWCREEKRKLIKEELLEKIPLSKEEMQMAKIIIIKE